VPEVVSGARPVIVERVTMNLLHRSAFPAHRVARAR
jgi:hypothetical protein